MIRALIFVLAWFASFAGHAESQPAQYTALKVVAVSGEAYYNYSCQSAAGNALIAQFWEKTFNNGQELLSALDGMAVPGCSVGAVFVSVELQPAMHRAYIMWRHPTDASLFMTYGVNYQTVLGCPDSSWTLNNGMCERQSCAAGQVWNPVSGKCRCESGSDVGDDGQCCPQPGEQIATMQHCYVSDASSTSCMTSAANGCTIRCTDVTFQKPKGGDQVVIGPFLALGQMCKYTGSYNPEDYGGGSLTDDELRDINQRTKTPGDPATPSSCLGQGMGYVTGSNGTTCVGSGKGGDVTKNTSTKTDDGKGGSSETTTNSTTGADGSTTTTKTTTTHNADGTTTTTTTTTSHNPDGSITETVKTETTDANGTKTGETTSKEETTDKGSWCSKHPDDPACQVEDCPEGSDKASCAKLGDPDGLPNPELPTEERGISSISPVGIASSASCPQGPVLPFGLGYMPLDGICDLASGIRPVLLALAWIGAGLIVIGAFRET